MTIENKLNILVFCRDRHELEIVFEEILLQEQEICGLNSVKFNKRNITTPEVNYDFILGILEDVRGKRVDQIIVNPYLPNFELSKLYEYSLMTSCVPREFQLMDLRELLEANKERCK